MSYSRYFGHNQNNSSTSQAISLLGAGWRPLNREMDWDFLSHLLIHDTHELTQKTLDAVSVLANTLGRNEYAWWANIIKLFSEDTRYDIESFWNYVTPAPPAPSRYHREVLVTETPLKPVINRNTIPIDEVLKQLQEITLLRILEILGPPDSITQYYLDRYFYYPCDRFVSWKEITVLGRASAYWSEHDLWLQVELSQQPGKHWYVLLAEEITSLVSKATYNLAIIVSGYQGRVGQITSQFSLRDFPGEIEAFTDQVQQAILDESRLAVLVYGEPGTGKTAWTQALAKEVLAPLGYVIFILDYDAVENFVPPNYLQNICLIINEADNLAKNRALEVAQTNSKTERILALLDGTLYQSIQSIQGISMEQKMVTLMTCNTTERLDPAILRKGRVDLMQEFTHRFV
ncbi:MAG: AAA family ATPase [Microcoleaceae cyanobacterium]